MKSLILTAAEIETLGLLKMDFLSLRNLTVMQETMEQPSFSPHTICPPLKKYAIE